MIEFFQPPRRLSCGIVIVNDARELLLCHVTGHDHWDLPKGGAMDGETALRGQICQCIQRGPHAGGVRVVAVVEDDALR